MLLFFNVLMIPLALIDWDGWHYMHQTVLEIEGAAEFWDIWVHRLHTWGLVAAFQGCTVLLFRNFSYYHHYIYRTVYFFTTI